MLRASGSTKTQRPTQPPALALAPLQAPTRGLAPEAVLAEVPAIVRAADPAMAAATVQEAAKVQVPQAALAPARAGGIWQTRLARALKPASPAAGATPPPEFAAAVPPAEAPVPWPLKPA